MYSTFTEGLAVLSKFLFVGAFVRWWGSQRERGRCGDPDVDGRIILGSWRGFWGLDGVGSG
jgi:hypothetical protein